MLLGCALALLALAIVNLWLGRSVLYPPTLFCLAWAASLAALDLGRGTYLAISDDTVLLLFAGAVALSAGAALESLLDPETGARRAPAAPAVLARADRRITLATWLLVLTVPIRLARLRQLGGGAIELSPTFWVRVRQTAIAESNESAMTWLSLTDNLVLLASFVALAAVASDVQRGKMQWRTVVATLLALAYNVSTASRASGMTLMCGLIGIAWLAGRGWSLRSVAYGALGVILVFSCAAVVMGKGGSIDATVVENVRGVAQVSVLYALGPVVALDRALDDPGAVPAVWSITYSVAQVANKLGAGIELPSIHAVFTRVGAGAWMNAYTIYFAYVPDLGIGGALGVLTFLGGALSWLYRRALGGSPHARLLYATMIAGLLMSGFAEYFFMNLSFYVKAALFSVVIYGLPRLAVLSRASLRSSAARAPDELRARAAALASAE